jgi:hypothetical protein
MEVRNRFSIANVSKRALPLILAAVLPVTLCGCNKSDNSSETSSSAPNVTEDYTETETAAVTSSAPSGVPATEKSSYAYTTTQAVPDGSGVSLTKDEFADVKSMVNFDGEFIPFEDMGYEYYTYSYDYSPDQDFCSFDNEYIYFEAIKEVSSGTDTGASCLAEYNFRTGELNYIDIGAEFKEIVLADRDFVIYSYISETVPFYGSDNNLITNIDEYEYAVYVRETGEHLILPSSTNTIDHYFPYNFVHMGKSIYYNVDEFFTSETGKSEITLPVVYRYIPAQNYLMSNSETAEILGKSESLYSLIKYFDGMVYNTDTLDHYDNTAIGLPRSMLYTYGDYPGYILPKSTNSIFGDSYSAGIVLYSTMKEIFSTNYGTDINEIVVSGQSAAAASIDKNDYYVSLLMDSRSGVATIVPDSEGNVPFISCDGDWLYFTYYSESDDGSSFSQKILAVNTLRDE